MRTKGREVIIEKIEKDPKCSYFVVNFVTECTKEIANSILMRETTI